jgi:hypothetical protein
MPKQKTVQKHRGNKPPSKVKQAKQLDPARKRSDRRSPSFTPKASPGR